MPQTTPPTIWLPAVFGLTMRPAAIALTTRLTLMVPRSSSTRTSTNTAEWVAVAQASRFSSGLTLASASSAPLTWTMSRSATACSPVFSRSCPSTNSTVSRFAPVKGEAGDCCTASSSFCRRPAQARCTALPTEDTVAEPPSSGACGRLESPRRNSTSLIGRPIASAAIWVIAV